VQYRAEIDGLRALAVVPVILFHAGLHAFGGGFVGVDVFFVISGYLITSIIVSEMDRGDFSIARFYERRARRILPALFLVLILTAPLAATWIVPEARTDYFRTLAGVSLFASNIVFWRQSGYFDSAAETKPLLHTWSLGVEEQFYLLFPLLLLLVVWTGRRRAPAILAVVAVASLALAQWAVARSPAASFFLLPTRAWELLAGAVLAVAPFQLPRAVRNIGAVAGMVMVVAAIFLFDRNTPTPSVYTLLPVLGTVMMIACARDDTLVGSALAARPLVLIGLISYSAYLWHQPLLALTRLRSIEEPSPIVLAILVGLTFVLAYLTWRFVETPFRRRASRKAVATSAIAATAFLLVGSVIAVLSLSSTDGPDPTNGRCNVGAADCFAVPGASRQVALWGDSYADAFASDLGKRLAHHGIALRLFVRNGCPSLVKVTRNEAGAGGQAIADQCTTHNRHALEVIRREKFDFVVLTSAYQTYLTQKNTSGQPLLVSPDGSREDPARMLSGHLRETILATGTRVLLVTPHPVVRDFPVQRKKLYFSETDQIYADYDAATTARASVLGRLAGLSFDEIDGRELLCARTQCPVVAGTRILLYDGSHLGPYLAGKLAARITEVILRETAP